jgi:Tol biopolymer transport system component
MFTTVGPHAFEGNVRVLRPDGSSVTDVLTPHGLMEYEAAYGNSLKTFILASVAQSTGGNNSVLSIVRYDLNAGTSTSLQQQLPPGQQGIGIPSPDNTKFVATLGPPGPQINLWISDFATMQFQQLTQGAAQDGHPSWRPDGKQIAFIRLLPPFSSLTTQLMTVPSQGGSATVLLDTSESVGEAAFSPDGKKLVFDSKNGLEIMDLASMQRTVILTLDQLHGSPVQRFTLDAGISWAKTEDKIVLIMLDRATGNNQLWTVTSDGSNFQRIFTAHPGGAIISVTFITN